MGLKTLASVAFRIQKNLDEKVVTWF